jgi:hypothetical protein
VVRYSREWAPESSVGIFADETRRAATKDGYLSWWEQLRADADQDGDGKVTMAEFAATAASGDDDPLEYYGRSAGPVLKLMIEASLSSRKQSRTSSSARTPPIQVLPFSATPDCRKSARPRRPGTSLPRDDRGQVGQRVVEMAWSERRKRNALARKRPYRRPVIGERDPGLVWTDRGQVVTPDPAAEL